MIHTEFFEDVRESEAADEADLRRRIDDKERAINLARRTLNLKGAAGFDDFIKAVGDLRESSNRQLVGCLGGNDLMRVIQGRVQALDDVLYVLRKTEETVARLAAERDAMQNQLDEAQQSRPNRSETTS